MRCGFKSQCFHSSNIFVGSAVKLETNTLCAVADIRLSIFSQNICRVGLLDSLNRTVTVTSPSDPALTLTGTLSSAMDTTGTWTFATASKPIYATSPLIGEYTLRFSSDGLLSVDQIVRVTLGLKGYQLRANLPSSFGPFQSSSVVTFKTFTIQVLDGGGNFMSSDRFNASDTSPVFRTIALSCECVCMRLRGKRERK